MRRSFALLLLLVLAPGLAHAHALGVDCKQRGGKVEVEAFYDDDAPAQKARVRVVDAQGETAVTGVTDERGRWTFSAPLPGSYEVRVDAGAGHRAKKGIEIVAVSPAASNNVEKAEEAVEPAPSRLEFTSFPWVRGLIGMVLIGVAAGIAAHFLRAKRDERR